MCVCLVYVCMCLSLCISVFVAGELVIEIWGFKKKTQGFGCSYSREFAQSSFRVREFKMGVMCLK